MTLDTLTKQKMEEIDKIFSKQSEELEEWSGYSADLAHQKDIKAFLRQAMEEAYWESLEHHTEKMKHEFMDINRGKKFGFFEFEGKQYAFFEKDNYLSDQLRIKENYRAIIDDLRSKLQVSDNGR